MWNEASHYALPIQSLPTDKTTTNIISNLLLGITQQK